MTIRPRRAFALAAPLFAAAAIAAPASAQDDASATGTVNVAVRSVTVTPTEFTFDECRLLTGRPTGTELLFPNHACDGPDITVTNGSAPANIHVRATDFTGSAGGTWDLLDRETAGPPQVDEVQLVMFIEPRNVGAIDTSDKCEFAVDTCAAAPGQSEQHGFLVIGPASSTSSSPSYSTTITWTALP